MTRIVISGEDLDLPDGFSLSIEETSPIFNDIGSQSIAVEVPDTLRNRRLLDFPNRPDSSGFGKSTSIQCLVISGGYIRGGILNTDSTSEDGISVNIGFDNSMAYDAWRSRKLSEIEALPCFRFRDMDAVKNEMYRLFRYSVPQIDDLAVFPVCVGKEEVKEKIEGEAAEGEMWFEVLNHFYYDDNIFLPKEEKYREFKCVIDGSEAVISVPNGYGCTPFVRVWRILDSIFKDIGLQMDRNPFRDDIELSRLVVLNNTADALCACTLDYAELMPDCTVEDFLHSLFVRFGLVYRTDFDSGIAYISLVREISEASPCIELDPLLTKIPETELRIPQYVRLSAGTSLEGTAPFTERLEDYIPDLSCLGKELEEYDESDNSGSRQDTDESPDFWPIDRNSNREEQIYATYWEGKTGKLWRSEETGTHRLVSSTSFFVWDPNPDGLEPLDLSSTDCFCPITKIGPFNRNLNMPFSYFWPTFTVGSRHFHTVRKGSEEESYNECPLSFMFALTGLQGSAQTDGLLSAYRDEDVPPEGFEDGSVHDLSLFFHYRIGLYAKFWKSFDMKLRSADRRFNVSVRISKEKLLNLDTLAPVKLNGVPMLIDTAETVIGDNMDSIVAMVLIPFADRVDGDDTYNGEVPDFPPFPDVLSQDDDLE